jgi:hypothetical protein
VRVSVVDRMGEHEMVVPDAAAMTVEKFVVAVVADVVVRLVVVPVPPGTVQGVQ